MKKNKKNIKISLIVNTIIFVSTTIIAIYGILFGAISSQPGENIIGIGYFKPFTMDSNILAGITSLLLIIYELKNKNKRKKVLPSWLMNLHLMSTTSLIVTFLVTLLILVPGSVSEGKSIFTMYEGELLFFHLINPILCLISFINLNKNYKYKINDSLIGDIPLFIYACIYVLHVVILKKWEDLYGFTFNGRYYLTPFVFILANLITTLISYILIKTHNARK